LFSDVREEGNNDHGRENFTEITSGCKAVDGINENVAHG
jgi:hypothetical protein